MIIESPCKGCDKRFVGCHASCESYKNFREELKKQKDIINKKKQTQTNLDGFFYAGPGMGTHQWQKRNLSAR